MYHKLLRTVTSRLQGKREKPPLQQPWASGGCRVDRTYTLGVEHLEWRQRYIDGAAGQKACGNALASPTTRPTNGGSSISSDNGSSMDKSSLRIQWRSALKGTYIITWLQAKGRYRAHHLAPSAAWPKR